MVFSSFFFLLHLFKTLSFKLLDQGLFGKLWSTGQIQPATWLRQLSFLGTQPCLSPCSLSMTTSTTRTELSSCEGDQVAPRAWNVCCLILYRQKKLSDQRFRPAALWLIHSFSKLLFSAYYSIPGTSLDAEDTAENEETVRALKEVVV